MATADVNGVELYYEVTGAGPRLVLTHGSWTDGSGWAPSVQRLAERFEVVTWDRRGHSRSHDGDGAGSRAEDAADLAGLIEHLEGDRVHVVGNSYGAIVTLTLMIDRPDLVASAAVHEPPLFSLLEGSPDRGIADALVAVQRPLELVAALIESGERRAAAEHFVDNVALGPGWWAQLPESFRAVLVHNADTYLDELHDPTALSIDPSGLVATAVPLLLTYGSASPSLFRAVIDEVALLVPAARIEVLDGAGHIPHATHPDQWTATLLAFHDQLSHADGKTVR